MALPRPHAQNVVGSNPVYAMFTFLLCTKQMDSLDNVRGAGGREVASDTRESRGSNPVNGNVIYN